MSDVARTGDGARVSVFLALSWKAEGRLPELFCVGHDGAGRQCGAQMVPVATSKPGRRAHFSALPSRPHIPGCDEATRQGRRGEDGPVRLVRDYAAGSSRAPAVRVVIPDQETKPGTTWGEDSGPRGVYRGRSGREVRVPATPLVVDRALAQLLRMAVREPADSTRLVQLPGEPFRYWSDAVVFAPDAARQHSGAEPVRAYWGTIRQFRPPQGKYSARLKVGDAERRRRPRSVYIPEVYANGLARFVRDAPGQSDPLRGMTVLVLGRIHVPHDVSDETSKDDRFYIEQCRRGGLAIADLRRCQ